MKGLLDPNNKLGQLLARLTEMMFLNLLVLLCCLPVITAGAALASMHNVLLKIYRGEGKNTASDFFKAMKDNLKNGTLLWLIYLGYLAVLVGIYVLAVSQMDSGAVYVVFALLLAALVGTLYITWALILQSRYVYTVSQCMKSAVLAWVKYPGSTFVFIVAGALLAAMCYVIYMAPLVLLLGFTLPGMLMTTLYNRVFIDLEGTEQEKTEEDGAEV